MTVSKTYIKKNPGFLLLTFFWWKATHSPTVSARFGYLDREVNSINWMSSTHRAVNHFAHIHSVLLIRNKTF